MSAISSGVCSTCDQKFYLSFGHPSWFGGRDWRNPKWPEEGTKDWHILQEFRKFQSSRQCPECYVKSNPEQSFFSVDDP